VKAASACDHSANPAVDWAMNSCRRFLDDDWAMASEQPFGSGCGGSHSSALAAVMDNRFRLDDLPRTLGRLAHLA
jgi:hypothetical protein